MKRGTRANAPIPAAINAATPTPSRLKPLPAITEGGSATWYEEAGPEETTIAIGLPGATCGPVLCRIQGWRAVDKMATGAWTVQFTYPVRKPLVRPVLPV